MIPAGDVKINLASSEERLSFATLTTKSALLVAGAVRLLLIAETSETPKIDEVFVSCCLSRKEGNMNVPSNVYSVSSVSACR